MDVSITRLLIILIEHLGLTVAAAFLILNMGAAGKSVLGERPWLERAILTLFFGLFAILGNYGFDPVHDAFANLRAMAVVTGGLFGGPWVGIGAGIIAGGHRFFIDIGGFTSAPCATATLIEGVAAGLLAGWYGSRVMNWKVAFGLGVAGESMHMGLVLLFASPFSEAVDLVRLIAVPMILVNSVGAAFFVELIKGLFREREHRESRQVEQILNIANLTVGYLRSGLGAGSAKKTAEIIFRQVDVAAVAITDTHRVLAHEGAGGDHHVVGEPIRTAATHMVLDDGRPLFRHTRREIACPHGNCPFHHGIIVPLKKGDAIVGSLKFYGTRAKPLDRVHFQTARGLAVLFSTQLELEEIQVQARMLAYAEISRLQAQINPHFLFNSLNTIASFCRTRPDRARELILDLSHYMRRNLDQSKGYITLKEELEQVEAYLAIEQARFGTRVTYRLRVEAGCESWPIPPLVIQPVVENAVKHGITPQERGGMVTISIAPEDESLKVVVSDDGVGMSDETLKALYASEGEGGLGEGIGVKNTIRRLLRIYGPTCTMKIESVEGQGTRVSFALPRRHPSGRP